MTRPVNIVWFKRDLRIHDHAPLLAAAQMGAPILPLYVVEPEYWQQEFSSRRLWHFIYDCLAELRTDCAQLGQPLVVRVGEMAAVLDALRTQYDIGAIFAHEETGNGWTYERDKAVICWCARHNISLHEYPSNGVVRRLESRDGWAKIRNMRMAEPLIAKPASLRPLGKIEPGEILAKDDPMFGRPVPGVTQKGGRRAGVSALKNFLNERGKEYIFRLSAPGPSEKYCSRLSPHLSWGTLSVREVVKANKSRRGNLNEAEARPWRRNLSAFGSRLAWRCHFVQKIEDQPSIEFRCMHPAFEGMREGEHNEDYFKAWMDGRTGYPFIDACIRNLVHEGWITFRMRAMLVSFASYHLWLDWRTTGHYLARLFTDYEPGIHYSQLQMQSGVTGINTLRIYSPIKQSQEHDPEGHFIRRWVPELADVPDSWIHEPWKMSEDLQAASHCKIGTDYPAPLVEHGEAVKSARAKIAQVRRAEGFRAGAGKVYQKLGSRKRALSRRRSSKNQKKSDDNQLSFLD